MDKKGQWRICAIWPQDQEFMIDLWTLKDEFLIWVVQQEPEAVFKNPSTGMFVIDINQDTAFAFKMKYL